MSTTVNMHEAKTHLSKWVDKANAGQEIILAKAGKPWARLMPLASPTGQRQPGGLVGELPDCFFDPLPEEELRAWEGR